MSFRDRIRIWKTSCPLGKRRGRDRLCCSPVLSGPLLRRERIRGSKGKSCLFAGRSTRMVMTRKVTLSRSTRCTPVFASGFLSYREVRHGWLRDARILPSKPQSSGLLIRLHRINSMYLGKVIGRVVSTVKDASLEGRKLLLIRRMPQGPSVVAVDAVGAGAGETVYVCRGREAAFAFKPQEVPTEASVVAIVDTIEREL